VLSIQARQFYLDSYALVRNPFSNGAVGNLLMVISDAFQPLSYWNGFMKDHSKYQGVALDHHSYDVFSNGAVAKSYNQHINVSAPSFEKAWAGLRPV
jgi:glucan 1,3-beta-glucosidase